MAFKKESGKDKKSGELLPLTQVELEILALIKEGYISKEIAQMRNCSPRTIEKHRSNILKKLDVESSQNALLIWILNNPKRFNT